MENMRAEDKSISFSNEGKMFNNPRFTLNILAGYHGEGLNQPISEVMGVGLSV